MEIRSNITEMTKKADNYGRFKKRMQSIREDLVDIITVVLCQDLVQIKMRGSTG